MKYTTQKLLKEQENGIKRNFLFFWGHSPNRDGSIGKRGKFIGICVNGGSGYY